MKGQGEHTIPIESASAQIRRNASAHIRQRLRHLQHPVELLLVAFLLPLLVIQVLAAARGIGADRLDVAVRMRADPDVLPRGRNDQILDAGERGLVGQRLAVSS